MTDSGTTRRRPAARSRPGKRDRLVAAATRLLYEQGVQKTTLADIAQAADVPVGNVYYYFKTKDEIISAVIDSHARGIQAETASLERQHRTPKARLKALISALAAQSELIAQYGCPHGTLCSELDKRATPPGDGSAADLLRIPVDWAERQFRAMGRRDARDLAVSLIAVYQGTALLTSTLRDPDLLARESRRLERWIDSLETDH
jgi:TetR/AcrR family transcriptional regulator, transcriptional repressor for nem operon